MVQVLFERYSSNIEMISEDDYYWHIVRILFIKIIDKVEFLLSFVLKILMSVAQGRIDTARCLLSKHPLKNTSVFKSVDEQLRTMPNFSSLSHLSLFEFKAKWEYWQKKCIQVLTSEDFKSEPTGSLEIICKVLILYFNYIIHITRH